jgi:intracellular sulfur oxidation DsrE/DsrF family protein
MQDTVILVTRNGLGSTEFADAEFGVVMLEKFLHTLERQPVKPSAVCFYTEGVKAALQDSPCATSLRLLKGLGVSLIACETCVNYYGIDPAHLAADLGGMPWILQQIATARKVVTI